MAGTEEKKNGFRVNPVVLTMIVSIMVIISQFMGFAYKFAEVKGDVSHLQETVVEIKRNFGKLDTFQMALNDIKVKLGKIETSIESLKR